MNNPLTFRLFANGGIISPEELRKITGIARKSGVNVIAAGFRQELYVQVEEQQFQITAEELASSGLSYAHLQKKQENIVTSFAALDILPTSNWLLGDIYLDILDQFNSHQPDLKINIVDPQQNLVPLFTGELNFIASAYPRYWYVYFNLEKLGKRQLWPLLIDGDDIGTFARLVEQIYLQEQPETLQALFARINQRFTGRSRQPEQELHFPVHTFPVLEGIHKSGSTYWLGIYRRNQAFSVELLEAIYNLCIQTKIGKICITPYKTLLIKDIRKEHLMQWEKLLGMYSINIQHSGLELNWQLPDLDQQAIGVKNTIVRDLEAKEACTSGLSIAVKTSAMEVASSVLIEKESGEESVFAVYHTADFTNYPPHWQTFARSIPLPNLASTLIDLSKKYYATLGSGTMLMETEEIPVSVQTHEVYQCPACLTVYDPVYGDALSDVKAGVSFHDLPDSYACNLCETPKSDFVKVTSQESIKL